MKVKNKLICESQLEIPTSKNTSKPITTPKHKNIQKYTI